MSSQTKQPPSQKKMRTIGRWYIGETLGKGGYSWVKKGFDKKTGKCVALKFMAKADESWAKEQSKQVVTEIESLKQIRHPHVMKLYAYNLNARYPTKDGQKIDTVLLVLEFAPGGEIFDILYYTNSLEPVLARTYFRQSILGLEACHNAGVAHRDIKPQNLLLDSRFNIKITDFGLSKVFESDADAIMKTTYVGTRGYQAPELLLDKPYDLACDIFSMAVVLFILICGYPPFEQAHVSDRWFKPLAKGDYAKFWKYHQGCAISNDSKCKDLLQRMLTYDPKQRITIAQIKKHPWFNGKYLEGKELIRALRHRHREMEAKRRKDARKIKDLNTSFPPTNKGIQNEINKTKTIPFPKNEFESIADTYTTKEPKEFMEGMHNIIAGVLHGSVVLEPENAKMICSVKTMATKKSTNSKPVVFELCIYQSRDWMVKNNNEENGNDSNKENVEEKENSNDLDNQINADEEAHSNFKKETIYVVRSRRVSGDLMQWTKIKAELFKQGAVFLTGLPNWALKESQNRDPFSKALAQYDMDEQNEDNYYKVAIDAF